MTTLIEWADVTINPVVGCSHCSPGCDHCYAERFAARMAKHPNPKISGKYADVVDGRGRWTGTVSSLDLSCFDKLPKSPKRILVGSMTDFFHEGANFEHQGKILSKMARIPQHTFMLLTKRPKNAWERYHTSLPNLWLGVTVCNQAEADEKIPLLLQTPAAVRFASVEPCLGPVDLGAYLGGRIRISSIPNGRVGDRFFGTNLENCVSQEEPMDGSLCWVICGGETGPGARPMHPDWVRSLRDQCQATGMPFFFKGWGEYMHTGRMSCVDCKVGTRCSGERAHHFQDGETVCRVGKRRAGRLLDGVEHNEFPEVKV